MLSETDDESADFFISETSRVIKLYKDCSDPVEKKKLEAHLLEIKRRLEHEIQIRDEED